MPETEIPPVSDMHLQKCLTFGVHIIHGGIFIYILFYNVISPSVQCIVLILLPLPRQSYFVISFHCALVPLNLMPLSPVQPKNAEEPMVVTLSGMVTLVRLEQEENAEEPMIVTPSTTTTDFIDERLEYQGTEVLEV